LSSPEKEKWFTTQRPFSCIFQSADMSRLSRHPGQAACLLECVRAGGRIRHSREHNHKRVTRTALGFRKEQLVNSESNVGHLVPHCSPSERTLLRLRRGRSTGCWLEIGQEQQHQAAVVADDSSTSTRLFCVVRRSLVLAHPPRAHSHVLALLASLSSRVCHRSVCCHLTHGFAA